MWIFRSTVPTPPCLYYRACALTVTMIEYSCLHEQQWCVCWWLNPIQSLVKSVRHYIPGGRYLSSASHTSSLDISSKTSFMSCTVSSGFLFSMISRTVFAQVEEVPIRCSFLSGILNFSPSFCQCLKWSSCIQMTSKTFGWCSRRSRNGAVSVQITHLLLRRRLGKKSEFFD